MRRAAAIAGMNILVQVIHVSWDKSGRGGAAAEQRNRIPLALSFPEKFGPEIGRHLLVHESHWGHNNKFESELKSKVFAEESNNGFRYHCASVRSLEAAVELEWTWNEWGGAPPRRIWHPDGTTAPATHRSIAGENECVRARWNGRFVCIDTGEWEYESVTVNVGVCSDEEIPADFFTRSVPREEYSQMMYLR